jgi:hypothetical protein
MKKYQILILATVLVFCISADLSVSRAAEIILVEGNVQVQSPADQVWKTAEKGMQVAIGDSVRTARHSKVEIALDPEKKNTLSLDEKTLVVLNSATADTIDRLDLSRGRVYSNLENIKAGLSFEVNTPSAVAGVRGSSYKVYVEKDEDEISAYKDTVFIRAYDADKNQVSEIMLPEGFKTFIERFEAPSALIQISNREFEKADNIREDLSSRAEGRERMRKEREDRKKIPAEEKTPIQQSADQATEETQVITDVTETKDLTEDSNTQENIEEFREEWTEPSWPW